LPKGKTAFHLLQSMRKPPFPADPAAGGPRRAPALGVFSGWPEWWRALPGARRLCPACAVLAYWAVLFALRGFRVEHLLLGLAVLAFAYAGAGADKWFRFLVPLALVAAFYDAQGYLERALWGWIPVHVSEPHAFDVRFFGIHTPAGVVTPAQWLQGHTHPALDLLFGAAYAGFIPAYVATALWFRLKGGPWTGKGSVRLRAGEPMMWSLFWLFAVSCATYHLYPAAPPWYAQRYGFGPVMRGVAPDPAGEIRIDRLLGFPLFSSIYSRAPDVFGAIPSLHAAIPVLAFLFACRAGSLRLATGLYALLVCAAALYFNHHYVLDVLWGAAYAALVAIAARGAPGSPP